MKTRKIVLLGAAAVLGCVAVIQLLTSPSGAVKSLALREKSDSILIRKGGASLLLAKEGDGWVVGDEKYPADADRANALASAVEKLKVFETLKGAAAGSDGARFGFGEEGGITVVASLGGKELRRLEVGKASSTSRQSYVRVDGGKDILLVSGNLAQQFGVGEQDLREKRVFTFAAKDVQAVEVRGVENFALSKGGDNGTWMVDRSASGKPSSLDAAKVDSWLASLAGLRAESFPTEGAASTGALYGAVTVGLGSRQVTLTVYDKSGDSLYLCASSERPYLFYASEYDVGRVLKPLADLAAK